MDISAMELKILQMMVIVFSHLLPQVLPSIHLEIVLK